MVPSEIPSILETVEPAVGTVELETAVDQEQIVEDLGETMEQRTVKVQVETGDSRRKLPADHTA